jgi:hypothetical protein
MLMLSCPRSPWSTGRAGGSRAPLLVEQRGSSDAVVLGDAFDPREVGLQGASPQAFEVEETNETGY